MKISVKPRLGVKTPDEFHRLLDVYNRYELEELIIHPRVREDYYRNTPHMDAFERAFARSRAPVCYNGDIFRQEDIERLRDRFPGLLQAGRGAGGCRDQGSQKASQRVPRPPLRSQPPGIFKGGGAQGCAV